MHFDALRALRGLIGCATLLAAAALQAQTCSIPGQAGAAAITAQPNTFFAGTGSPAAGATSISVGAGSGVNRGIEAGDLLLIIQMQGGDIDTTNDRGYGNNVGPTSTGNTVPYNNNTNNYAGGYLNDANFIAGRYEWAVAAGGGATFGGGGTINLSAPLVNAYATRNNSTTVTRRSWQVVRVPQYANLVLGANLTLQPWDGSKGGMLVLEATGDIDLNGRTINGTGAGFRGGGAVEVAANTTCTGAYTNTSGPCRHYVATIAASLGGSKGEGLSGTPARLYTNDPAGAGTGTVINGTTDGYPGGEAARGAPGNAGGGGNQHNGGGGGGGNGGAGGQGGNTWNSSNANFVGLVLGGFGGAPSGNAPNRWIMGGGGGAGDVGGNAVTSPDGSGGAGGGIVVLRASRIDGGGAVITVDGAPGIAARATDAAGGGGAGGTVIITASTAAVVGGLTVNARGGAGGAYLSAVSEQDGAGGGGGGGYIIDNVTGVTTNVTAGAAGATASTACDNGADCGQDAGYAGTGNAGYTGTADGVLVGYECLPDITVSVATTTPLVTASTGGTAAYVVTVSNNGGGARFVTLENQLPPGWAWASNSAPSYTPVQPLAAGRLSSGAETVGITNSSIWSVGTNPLSVSATPTVSSFALAPRRLTAPSQLTFSFVASIPDTATVGTYHMPVGIEFLDPTRLAAQPTRLVSPATLASANRTATAYAATTYANYNGAGTTNVAGSNYNGLVAGPTTEDVQLIADFSVTKTAPASVTPLVTFSYVITARNNGRPIGSQSYSVSQASDVSTANVPATFGSSPLTVTDSFTGSGVTLTTAFAGAGWSCSGSAPIVCTLPNASAYPIANGTDFPALSATAMFTPTCIVSMASVTNSAQVSAPAGESVTTNNTDTAVVSPTCVSANLTLSKTNGTATVAAGSTFTYTLTVANLGPGDAPNTVIQDPAATGLSCSTVSCAVSAGTASCPASLTVAGLQGAGLALPAFNASSTVTFALRCQVTATGS
ncbi:MAG: hypothetical protein AB7I35_21060 [Ramlibacter sp.]